jgi:UDP-N-acetylmuramoylalanine--D-glutamate ligase
MTIDARHPLPGTQPLVVGLARSGLAAARLLLRHGADVVGCDRRRVEDAPEEARAFAALGAPAHWGRDDASLLEGRDLLVVSPGVPEDHALVRAARAAGLPTLSELELGYRAAHAPLLAVTGTNGKSTTTDLAGALVRAGGRETEVCGNIGRALCEVADQVSPRGLLVVEVSSFQLETVDQLRPWSATWLNLTPDHLDRHGSYQRYAAAKQRLFARQQSGDYAAWNADDPEVMSRRTGSASWLHFSAKQEPGEGAFAAGGALWLGWRGGRQRLLAAAELRIRGPHNLMNALAALALTLPLEIPLDALREALRAYPGLEHRLEPCGEVGGVEFVNDSKATNVNSLEVALGSFPRPVVLIAGGRDKGQDFAPLAALVRERAHRVVLIGEGAAAIERAWGPGGVAIERAGSLAEAVERAFRAAQPDGTVLLSPGCASFDMFRDYEDRGRRFKAEVARLAAEVEA